MKKTLSVVLALVMILSLAACGGSSAKPAATEAPATEAPAAEEPAAEPEAQPEAEPEAEPAAGPVTVTDMMGREITLEKPAERIVALTASDCEILYAVGAGDLLVARGTYCDYPAEVTELPELGSGYDTNVEDIIAMDPDVLLMSTMAQTEEQVAALEAAGVAVVVSDAQDVAGTYQAIRMIGALVGKDEAAEAVVAEMEATFAELEEAVAAKNIPEDEKPTVYFEVSPIYYGLWAAGGGSFMNEIADMLGMKNIFAEGASWESISEEQVIAANPDYIVTITMYFGEEYESAEAEIMARPGWENITAVKNGAILLLPNNELSRPAPRLADGARMLYEFVYENAQEDAA